MQVQVTFMVLATWSSVIRWATGWKCFATLVMVTLVYGRPYAADRDMMRGGELFSECLHLGMFVMISGNNFLVITSV
jgi:hypothetical protein